MFGLRGKRKPDLTLFFATDVHGSNLCFRKMLAAPDFYGADVVVLGGDLTGKMIVPVVCTAAGWEARYLGGAVPLRSQDEVAAFEKSVSDAGYYPFRTSSEEIGDAGPQWQARVFEEQVSERLRNWDRWASERMPVYVAPGNDDEMYVDAVLDGCRALTNVESKAVDLAGGYTLHSTGWANRTPWHTPREMDEDDLYARLRSVAAGVEDPARAIMNLHVPPKDSGLDTCYEVNEDLEVVTEFGQPRSIGGGSTAVRRILEETQPLISLHGHIHESRGMTTIGRTTAFNPGSEYSEGILRGVIVKLAGETVAQYQFTSG